MGFVEARKRLDQILLERGVFDSRSRARDAILRGTVQVDGRPAEKPGQSVSTACEIRVDDPALHYVSRAALKLDHAIESFGLSVQGAKALDVGASTGGFTQVLLEEGAEHVVALDVGHDQLHQSLRDDPRVTVMERFNARDLKSDDLPYRPDVIVSDVSFVSLRLALKPALELAPFGARCVLLVKPQFELSPEMIGKGGIVRNVAVAEAVAHDLRMWLDRLKGWRSLGVVPSPILGGEGNREFLLAGVRNTE
ncbi:TlyA family RNA methyltransferase [Notoacmeibacter ruber]|uniref:TlyA family RNA methyltransferase n=1 Tax=Notoacmeibacter ruber TaxID=2670375 RepID=A0A3L7JA00_9HYPH|nr:TlyA family RNA methyltransferase [Notoacmeibacter ruber]RLQ87446.1 TlyA family RNA methyltransferase [Notoacmeibacter ruber]